MKQEKRKSSYKFCPLPKEHWESINESRDDRERKESNNEKDKL